MDIVYRLCIPPGLCKSAEKKVFYNQISAPLWSIVMCLDMDVDDFASTPCVFRTSARDGAVTPEKQNISHLLRNVRNKCMTGL